MLCFAFDAIIRLCPGLHKHVTEVAGLGSLGISLLFPVRRGETMGSGMRRIHDLTSRLKSLIYIMLDTPRHEVYPPRASLTSDVYRPFPVLPDKVPSPEEVNAPALVVKSLRSLTDALGAEDVGKVKSCFLTSQSYWRDLLSLTYHIRTFNDASVIAPAMITLMRKRGLVGGFELIPGSVNDVVVSPSLRWVQAMFTFKTLMPKSMCEGRVVLFPQAGDGDEVLWKIWSLSTWLEGFEEYPENVKKLKAAGRDLQDVEHIDTDVFIIGGGNA